MSENKNETQKIVEGIPDESPFSERTEHIFKIILRSLSWIVGICFLLIIIFPMFDNAILDIITKILFYIGIINLFIFTILEFVSELIKQKIEKKIIK